MIRNKHQQSYENGFKRNPRLHKHIHKVQGRFRIEKSVNGERKVFKSFKNLHDAIKYRDKLAANDWEPLPLTAEEVYEQNHKEYYMGLIRTYNGRRYQVNNCKGEYLATIAGIEEALYYRDKYYTYNKNDAPRPSTLDLTTNNWYINEGLEYPIPERLIPFKKSTYGEGRIVKKGEFSYAIEHGKKENYYICSCRTYEQAWYVKKEMNKCGWDRTQLQRILDDYPVYYTKLMELYRYINPDYQHNRKHDTFKYLINVPREFLEEGKKIDKYTGYTHIEDALYERDFLVEYDWDYDALVECIDDTKNPYYDMDLPPFPQRTIRNLSERNYHEKELTMIHELINDNNDYTQAEICDIIGITEITLRNWLKKFWNSNYKEFQEISMSGENPINVLEKVPIIYQPDLSRPKPSNFKGYIQFRSNNKRSPYQVIKDNVRYGSYFTEKQAKTVVRKLKACNWDKTQLPKIQESVGWKPLPKRGNIYPNPGGYGWSIRHKDKSTRKFINYGCNYKDYDLAVMVRDMLILNDWNKDEYPSIRILAEDVLYIKKLIAANMFSGVYDYNYLEGLCNLEDYNSDKYIFKTMDGFRILKLVNGNITYFGYYKTYEEAMAAQELLIDNNWDNTVLDLVEELGL